MLTCQVVQDHGVRTTLEPADTVPALSGRQMAASQTADSDTAGRPIAPSRPIDARRARMAVSLVETTDGRDGRPFQWGGRLCPPLLRLCPSSLGASDWVVPWLRHCGLPVRNTGDFLLVAAAEPGGDAATLRSTLQHALSTIDDSIDRVRDNLQAGRSVGHKGIHGGLESILVQGAEAEMSAGHSSSCIDFSPGPIEMTGQALDLAIDGLGLFVLDVGHGDGSSRIYARDGRFTCLQDGTIAARAVAGATLVPRIVVARNATRLVIAADGAVQVGTVTGPPIAIGRIALEWFEHPEHLHQIGPGLFARTPKAGRLIRNDSTKGPLGTLVQGALEQSNVDDTQCRAQFHWLEDARQIALAMIDQLDHLVAPASRRCLADAAAPGQLPTPDPVSMAGSSDGSVLTTITFPLPEPALEECEPALLTYLHLRGVDLAVTPEEITLPRHPRTASTLVEYLKLLRLRLEVIEQNVANASRLESADGSPAPYRRRIVRLNERGEGIVLEDMSPWRMVWVDTSVEGDRSMPTTARDAPGGHSAIVTDVKGTPATVARRRAAPTPQPVAYPNVDIEYEMADSDAVLNQWHTVREALVALGSKALGPMTELLKDHAAGMGCEAACVLGQIGPEAKGALPALIDALSAGDWELRKAAARAGRRIAPDSSIVTEAILEMWTAALGSSDRGQRYEAAVALGRMGPVAVPAIEPLIRLLDDPTSGAARSLGRMGEAAAPAVGPLARALRHRDAHVRQQAADALGRIGSPARPAVPNLVSAMKDGNPDVRWRAAAAIALIGARDSGCLEAVAELLRDEERYVRDRVAKAILAQLISQGSPTAVPGLAFRRAGGPRYPESPWNPRTAPKCDSNPWYRPWAWRSLARFVSEEQPQFARGGHAVWTLLSHRPPSPADLLAGLILRADLNVKSVACHVLAKLGPWAAPALGMLTDLAADEDQAVAAAALEAIAAVGSPATQAVPMLAIALDSPHPGIRLRAFTALGKIGPGAASAVPALIARLEDPSEQVVLAAVEALRGVGPKAGESADALRRLEDSPIAAIRGAAKAALVDIVGRASLPAMAATEGRPTAAGTEREPRLAASSNELNTP